MRVAAAVLLLGLAALLLIPAPPAPAPLGWDELIAPLAVGRPITRGYVLAPPRRGDGDVVYVAYRPASPDDAPARVELHIMNRGRWTGIGETRSFGIGWEVRPAGSPDAAPVDDARAVAEAVRAAVQRNDSGNLSVDAIALAGEPQPPLVSRVLARLSGARGRAVGLAVAVALVSLCSVRGGAVAVGVILLAVGLALRAPSLDVPFLRDQDVQRMLTGNLSVHEIATGAGLKDRHPPLYFFVLHAVQRLGQSEAIGRAPAVLAGALLGPAILLAARLMCGRIGLTAVIAALAVTASPDLIARSREVSEIPLFALLVMVASAALVGAARRPRLGRLAVLASAQALALWTYYLAPFVVAAHALILVWWRPRARVFVAFILGVLAGMPAILLAVLTFRGDAAARSTAHTFPLLAWGEHAPDQILAHMGRIAVEAFGLPFVLLAGAAVVIGARRRSRPVITAAAAAAAVVAGIVVLSPVARVQAYYVSTVLPMLALVVAVTPEPRQRAMRTAWGIAALLAVAWWTVPSLVTIRSLFVPDADAFMPRFAAEIAQRPEPTVVVVAHYDKAALGYYLARLDGHAVSWETLDAPGTKRIEPLIMVHAVTPGFEAEALRRLDEIISAGPTLVIDRDAATVAVIEERLASCDRLLEAPSGRLLRCTARD